MTLDAFIERFGAAIGIEGLALDAEGQCQLAVGDVVVDITGDRRDGRLILSCLLGELPAADAEGAMRRLLDANSMLDKTAGATIGVPGGSDAAVLARAIDHRREDDETFAAAVAHFATTAERLRPLLAPQRGGGTDDPRAEAGDVIFRM